MRELVTVDSIVWDTVRRAVIGWDRWEAPALSVRAHTSGLSHFWDTDTEASLCQAPNRVLILSDSKSLDRWRSAPSGSSTFKVIWHIGDKCQDCFREHWSWQLLLSRIVAAGKSFEQTSVYIFMVTIERNDITIDKSCITSCHCNLSTQKSFLLQLVDILDVLVFNLIITFIHYAQLSVIQWAAKD